MRNPRRIFLPILCVFCAGLLPLRADSVDQFLQDVAFVEAGQGVSNALKMVESRLAKGGLSDASRGRVLERKVELLVSMASRLGWGAERDAFRAKTFSVMEKDVFPAGGIDPALKLRVYDRVAALLAESSSPGPWDARLIAVCELALHDPAVAKEPARKAAFLSRVADRQAARGCKDLAFGGYRSVAALQTDPEAKAAALFRAATLARELRDLPASAECLDEIARMENLSYKLRKRALLYRGENAIFADEHSWTPDAKHLAEARKYIAEALSDRSPLAGTDEAHQALLALIKAEAKGGELAEAVKTGKGLLDGPGKDRLNYQTRANLAVVVADTLHEMGDYKGAVKYYERAVSGSTIGPKNVQRRIATSARAGGDFFRAMQAYSDAIKFCDPVEGQDEIAHFASLIRLMNKNVRKGSAAVDSESMFSDTDEELSGLTLDEE